MTRTSLPQACPLPAACTWPAPAELNLFLHVTGRRADGYHQLQTVFQFVDLHDKLYFVPRGDGAFTRRGAQVGISADDDLELRAARAIRQALGANLGPDLRMVKRLAHGAGLGGRSTHTSPHRTILLRRWK